MQHDIAIKQDGPHSASVRLDGSEINKAVIGFDLSASINGLPTVTLHLVIHEMSYEGRPLVVIPEATKDVLLLLGWSPPEGAE